MILSIDGRFWVDKTGMDLVQEALFFVDLVGIVGGQAA